MAYLDKQTSLFQRDENGELIAQEVTLDLLPDKPKIRAVPMTRGKIQELMSGSQNGETTRTQDADIISKYCKQPSFSIEEANDLKPVIAGAIMTALLSISLDVPQKDIAEQGRKALVENQEALLKKN